MKRKIKKCNTGGKVGFGDVASLATAFANPVAAIPSALNFISKLTYNPASYTPAKMNESPMGFAYGGDLEKQLQMIGGADKEMGTHAVEVQGNPGIDTNYRNIGGQDVALTKGEVVRQDPDGTAYVWSNNPKMKHPSGKTFAEAMKPVENKINTLKNRLKNNPTDSISQTTLGHLEQIIEQNKNIEESMRQKNPIIPNYAMDVIASSALEKKLGNPIREGFENYSMVQNRVPLAVSPTITRDNSPFRNPKGFIQANPSPLTSVTGNGLPKGENYSTAEDKAFLAAKSLETALRVGAALKKPIQYDTRRYNIDKINVNPQRVLDANESSYQGANTDINTGNANTDRILRNNLYSQKMMADKDAIRQYRDMQTQSDLQVNQYNAQAKANVDNINEQIQGRDYQATDAALTSIGNLSSIFQQAGAAKAGNKITQATLNSLSNRYGIDINYLSQLIGNGQVNKNKNLVKYKGDGNG